MVESISHSGTSRMDRIFAQVPRSRQTPSQSSDTQLDTTTSHSTSTQPLPKGVVLGKDGKPCRTCTSSAAWMAMMKQSTKKDSRVNDTFTVEPPTYAATTSQSTEDAYRACPPDVDELGRSTWTLLHSLPATYPERPSESMKSQVRQFLSLFSNLYPCWVCATDLRDWMKKPENEPRLDSQDDFGRWMCEAHNEVNRKLGKDEFDCNLWKQRWKDGWGDGRCE